jgi:hypothetical protein
MNAAQNSTYWDSPSIFLLLEAWWELLRALVLVRLPSGRAWWLQDALSVQPGKNDRALTAAVSLAVNRASRYHIRPMRCLNRSLALLWMLRRRGIATALRLGCRRQGEALDFHAWVVDAEAKPLNDIWEHSAFFPLRGPDP